MNPIILILIKDVILPEVVRAWKAAHGGQAPTDDQVFAELERVTREGIAEGKAFLARTTPPAPPG